ncbi:MAG TPA: hypothetical protein VGC63_10635 [Solirubrobacterales bacterium]
MTDRRSGQRLRTLQVGAPVASASSRDYGLKDEREKRLGLLKSEAHPVNMLTLIIRMRRHIDNDFAPDPSRREPKTTLISGPFVDDPVTTHEHLHRQTAAPA